MPVGVRSWPACSQDMPAGSGVANAPQPVGSRLLPNWRLPTRWLSLESLCASNGNGPARPSARPSSAVRGLCFGIAPPSPDSRSLVELGAAGVVRTMDVAVAAQATASHHALVRHQPVAQVLTRQQIVRMVAVGVALLAQHRYRQYQQVFLVRAVRGVAIEAVLAHRRVLEQERAALLGMAGGAGLVDGVGLQQRRGDAAVRVVAIDAG